MRFNARRRTGARAAVPLSLPERRPGDRVTDTELVQLRAPSQCLGTPGRPCARLTYGSRCPICESLFNRGRWSKRNKSANYGYQWRQARAAAKERDGHRCQLCGVVTERLSVHHKRSVRRGGTHDLSNLISLCVTCHGRLDGGRR